MGGHAFASCFCDSHLPPILRNKLGVVWQLGAQGNWQCFPLLRLSNPKARNTEGWVRIGHNIKHLELTSLIWYLGQLKKQRINTTLVPIPHHCAIQKLKAKQAGRST